ncbi:MAG TPA: MOSC domain-containing protein [Pyrinomonadaceae bacterium]|jgi:hypothetical protein|nr:MOSC domain-containing protein [Pyrinomonadaceae bacterium]
MEENREVVLRSIYVYPVKSLKGMALEEARVEPRGLQYDRRWMLVDKGNTFITQRERPRMAMISVRPEAEGLRASAGGMEDLLIPYEPEQSSARVQVKVWRSVCGALVAGREVNEWFSRFLQLPCRLVYMPDDVRRAVNPVYAVNRSIVSFADGYPFHVFGEASLADLNERLDAPVPVNRFRPNFVLSGAAAFAEDDWKRIKIGDTLFHVVKPCDRCVITTTDQERGVPTGREPLKTLATYRTVSNKVLFGQYLVAERYGGQLRIGDRVEIISRKGQ